MHFCYRYFLTKKVYNVCNFYSYIMSIIIENETGYSCVILIVFKYLSFIKINKTTSFFYKIL